MRALRACGLLLAGCTLLLLAPQALAQGLPGLQLGGDATDDAVAAEPNSEPVQVGPGRVSDREIEAMLRAVFAQVEELEDVRVAVQAGVVQLTGTAASADSEDKAIALARRLEGVLYVDNDLTLPTQAEEQIAPALKKAQQRIEAIAEKLPLLALAAVVVVIGFLLARLVRGGAAPNAQRSRNPLVRGLYRQIAGAVVLVASLVLALDLLQATALLSAVLGAAGVLGLTLGLALRDIVENYLSSILLSLRRPFDPHDLVRIGEHEGRVMRLTTRDTTLMTLEGVSVRLPNSTVFKSVIINFSRNPLRQFNVTVGIATHQSLLEAQRIGLDGLARTPGVEQEPPPFTRVESFGSSYMELRLFGWVNQKKSDWWKVRSEAVRHLKGAFEQAGIELPPPSLQIQTIGVLETQTDGREGPRLPAPAAPTEDLTQQAHEVAQDDHLQLQMDSEDARPGEEDLLCDDGSEPGDRPAASTARPR